MPPKRGAIGGVGRPAQQKGYARYLVGEVTNPENRSVVTSIAFFAVSRPYHNADELAMDADDDAQAGVAFLHSSWSEVLLPPSVLPS